MIHGLLSTLENYKGINKDFAEAIDYVLTHDLEALPVGNTRINDKTVISKLVGFGKEKGQSAPELHKVHLDLQIVLHGAEYAYFDYYTTELENHIHTPYNSEKDVVKFDMECRQRVIMDNTNFTLFTPNDVHMPSQKIDDNEIVKLVIKTEI